MKKKILMMLVVIGMLVAGAMSVSAETYGEFTYTISNGEVTITDCDATVTEVTILAEINGYPVTTIGYHAFADCISLENIKIPESVTSIGTEAFMNCKVLESVDIPNGVTSIERFAFSKCTGLKKVTLPASFVEFGENMFAGCTNLEEIIIDPNNKWYYAEDGIVFDKDKTSIVYYAVAKPDTSYTIPSSVIRIERLAFYECNNLTSISIHNNVADIEYGAIMGCKNLTDIVVADDNYWYCVDNGVLFDSSKTMLLCYPTGRTDTSYKVPDSVTMIWGCAFINCENLVSIEIPQNITNASEIILRGCKKLKSYVIPEGTTQIRDSMFFGCESLENVEIPDSVTSIQNAAFNNCKSLKSMDIPSKVTSLGAEVFKGCTSLESVDIPNGVTHIGNQAFNECSSLKNISIPSGVTTIGTNTFWGCTSLESVEFLGDVTSIDTFAFFECANLKDIEIPKSVTSIGNHAFYGCSSIKNVEIPSGMTQINNYTFAECTSLESVTLPRGLETIGDWAFWHCHALPEIKIPDSVTTIGRSSLSNCFSLEEVNVSKYVENIGMYAFYNGKSMTKITVDPENPNYTSKDGVLFNKDMTTLICYPVGKTEYKYEIPDGVKVIGDTAFDGSTNLIKIVIPKSVETVELDAFANCTALRRACYKGSESDWENVTVGDNNEALINALSFTKKYDIIIGEIIVEETADNFIIDVTFDKANIKDFDNAFMYVALYGENSEFLGFETYEISKDETSKKVAPKADGVAESMKILLWNQNGLFTPLCNTTAMDI